MPSFQNLLDAVSGVLSVHGDTSNEVTGIAFDTRRMSTGNVFVAIPGFRVNALELVPRAVGLGASAIVAEQLPRCPVPIPVATVDSARAALGDLSAAFFGYPSRFIPTVGITGTDGKTSTTHLLSAVLAAHGYRTGWLTTVSTKIGESVRENSAENTTPEAPIVQATLAEMRSAGLDIAILETSSHALELERVRGVAYRVGVFTNLSPEHINFHGSIEAYRRAKSRLFATLPETGLAVLNADDPSSREMAARCKAPVLWYGASAASQLWASELQLHAKGTQFTAHFGTEALPIRSKLVGKFNVANWLAALGAASYFGATLADLATAAAAQEAVPGRMNLVDQGQPFAVVVDFAHTPGALANVLEAVRGTGSGRVLLVFGLAGGRDFHNRPVMGALAVRRSNYFVISTDDPGEEAAEAIAAEIARGAQSVGGREGREYSVHLDRREAIRHVLEAAAPGDTVVLAGKGHERRMVVGTQRIAWNDAEVAREELLRLGFAADGTRG